MFVELAFAGDRAFASDVEGCERIDLASVGDADDHAKLLMHVGVRRRHFHAPVLERRPDISFQIGKKCRSFDGLRREAEGRSSPNCSGRWRDWAAILGQQRTGDAIEGAGAFDVVLDNYDARGSSRTDGLMQVLDGCFFQTECWLLQVT